jgi:pseudaminic acid biosynthesis-associated methylase
VSTYSQQEDVWSGSFGQNYTNRSILTPESLDDLFVNIYGTSRKEMNETFLADLDRNARILEVGPNMGSQLAHLQSMGFTQLYGLELQHYAVEMAKKYTENINIIQGSAFDIPFKDGFFDLVFTSGVLIHISPQDLPKVMSEVIRCSKKYIWGLEYYSPQIEEINYRGHEQLLWKADYAQLYQNRDPQLSLLKQEFYPYLHDENRDAMFLLRKAES